jgi:hypothetical protein
MGPEGINSLQQVAPQVPVVAGKQAAQAGHHPPDELVTTQHPERQQQQPKSQQG